MFKLDVLRKITEFEWDLPRSYRSDMRVPVHFFATRDLLESIKEDRSIEQAINVSTFPGIVSHVAVMPDIHQGYGFPIGGVAATSCHNGVISPGGIGYDINCGVRLLSSSIHYSEAEPFVGDLATALNSFCPSGVGSEGARRLSQPELDSVCRQGAGWALKQGFGSEEDMRMTESHGCIEGGDPRSVSSRAKERGKNQLVSLGAGNHFIEIDVVEQVFDEKAAQGMGLQEGCLTLMIHCGSRGFGHQVCTDYVQLFQGVTRNYGIELPDRELVCAPVESQEGQQYLEAMRCAANYAFANRQILAHQGRMAFAAVLGGKIKNIHLHQVYDVAHNLGSIESQMVNGKPEKICVHRKGATRALGAGSPGLPEEYKFSGQPVLVPGSMGTASWVLNGTSRSMELAFGSCCHGAGRLMSRSQAKREERGERIRQNLEDKGIRIRAGSNAGLAEESPRAYKDVDQVVDTVCGAGIANRVARLRPVAVIKG